MKKTIIGVCGPLGCGKSTVSKVLTEEYGFQRHFFAKPLKEMLKCVGLTEEHVNGSLKEKPTHLLGGKTPRYAMQTLGTEWARTLIHSDFWVMAWENSMPNSDKIVVDDLRFPNELDKLRELGATIVEVRRPGVERTGHASEAFHIDGDIIIDNDGTVTDLYINVKKVADNISKCKP